ncbi:MULTISPECIES: hypothetical protein [Meiothermus]|uniref:Uncharacterized protein n=1 Tax=Meiothermus ruber (strain ATCC 35948 / DSM 1279 / VKM B-1258 / 21) TaxID=504728 RepID=M9X5V6_MEIRD|nr:hypothetical protein [Meiothermus ruber]AGK03327.1 hypothetical protein K649_00065 [Meiothermus ruber DSM 1279]AGK04652.1 hypothetical protein K649_06760 [Meiothermus ruber DSM 1279]
MQQPPVGTAAETEPAVLRFPDPAPSSTDEGFQNIEDNQGEASFSDLPPEPPSIEPFTGADLVQGATWMLILGLRLQTQEEVEAFTRAFQGGVLPMLPPAPVLDALKVGEALAAYGIGKNRLPLQGGVEHLPPWLRILLGAGVMAMSVYGGMRAVQEIRARSAPNPPAGGSADEPAQA